MQTVVREAEDWWRRTARRPASFALAFLAAGFTAVFLHQADELTQLVFGAPIFEEAFKFGLALLATAAGVVSRPGIRIAVAWAVGAGFGWLEHVTSYPAEEQLVFWGRLAFHGAATGLSMTAYVLACRVADPRARWVSTIPASLLHYANNTGQLWLESGAGALRLDAPTGETIAKSLFFGIVVALVLAQALLWPAEDRYRRTAGRLAGGVLDRL